MDYLHHTRIKTKSPAEHKQTLQQISQEMNLRQS